jgi:D-inositol-3-phosphate glycosyltransferase
LLSIVRKLAVLSMHTSPLAQPGAGDGGGMNVYVRELSAALARAGVECDVYTRADDREQAPVVNVEPGFRVHHVAAGPVAPVPKEALPELIAPFTAAVLDRMAGRDRPDLIHANYWLSGMAGHTMKHELDVPLVCTFHTLDRVKADADLAEQGRRAAAEAQVIGCSDAILASCTVEAAQIQELYGVESDRIEIIAPAVDHAFFAPGNRHQARRALGFPTRPPMLLFVGRIQPLKSLDVAVRTLAALRSDPDAMLVVVGGPSGPGGAAEVERIKGLVADLGLAGRVRFVPPQRHELLSTYYRAADVCIVPSRSESFGLVALEAAACGTPVVAAAVGGLTTLVEHGRTGYLVEGRDPADYARCVDRIVSSHELAAGMSVAAASLARRYTWSVAGARLRRLYADLTARQLVECR